MTPRDAWCGLALLSKGLAHGERNVALWGVCLEAAMKARRAVLARVMVAVPGRQAHRDS